MSSYITKTITFYRTSKSYILINYIIGLSYLINKNFILNIVFKLLKTYNYITIIEEYSEIIARVTSFLVLREII